MFGIFKKKPLPELINIPSRGFIEDIFQKIRKISSPEVRLTKYVDFCEQIRVYEREFNISCIELSIEHDEIRDTFFECTDFETLYTCAFSYGLLRDKVDLVIKELIAGDLPEHLKIRLVKLHILTELDDELADPREYEIKNQNAFFEVEKIAKDEFEKARLLESMHGISNWKSREEMNPHIMYD